MVPLASSHRGHIVQPSLCVSKLLFSKSVLCSLPPPTCHKGLCWSRGPAYLGGGRGHRVPFLGGMAPSGIAPASTNRPHRRLLWSCGLEEINVMGTAPNSSGVSAWRNLRGWLGLGIIVCPERKGEISPPWHVYDQ